jgi:hypothetical protein
MNKILVGKSGGKTEVGDYEQMKGKQGQVHPRTDHEGAEGSKGTDPLFS